MTPTERIMFAVTSAVFSAIALGGLLLLGSHLVQTIALVAAFLGAISQFTGQDPKAFKISIYTAYGAFVSGALAILMFALGN